MTDKVKFALAILVLVAGIVGYYVLAGLPQVVRVLVVLAGVGGAIALAYKSEPGRRFMVFAHEAIIEARKVVWPSRKETVQMTGIVFLFVLVMAIFLWLTDKTLEWVFYDLILGWK